MTILSTNQKLKALIWTFPFDFRVADDTLGDNGAQPSDRCSSQKWTLGYCLPSAWVNAGRALRQL